MPSEWNARWRRAACLAGIYLVGLLVGLGVWSYIRLPCCSPGAPVGLPALLGYHPANNILRFLALVVCPTALLGLLRWLGPVRLRRLCFEADRPPPELPASPRGTPILVLALALLAALNTPTVGSWGPLDTFHEGESLGPAISHLHGQVAYQDYLFLHGLYQDPLRSVLAFGLFGRSIGAARTLESAVKVVTFLLLASLLVAWFRPDGVTALAAMAGLAALPALETVQAGGVPLTFIRLLPREVTTLSFLLAAGWLFRTARRASPRAVAGPAALASFIATASFSYSIDRGFFLVATEAALCVMVAGFLLPAGPPRRWFCLATAAGSGAGAVLLAWLLRWRLQGFLRFVFLEVPRYQEWVDGLVFDISHPVMLGTAGLMAANCFWLARALLASPGLGAFVRQWRRELLLLVLSLCLFRAALGRADVYHVAGSSWPTLLLAFRLFLRPALARWGRPAQWVTWAAAAGLALLFTVRLLGPERLLRENFPAGRPDALYLPDDYQAVTRLVKENLAPGESFFTMTSEALWYYLLDQSCPARFSSVWLAAPPIYQREIIESLERSNVKLVLYGNRAWSNQIDGISNEQRLPLLVRYLRSRYAPWRTIDGHEIWKRLPDGGRHQAP